LKIKVDEDDIHFLRKMKDGIVFYEREVERIEKELRERNTLLLKRVGALDGLQEMYMNGLKHIAEKYGDGKSKYDINFAEGTIIGVEE